MKTLIAAGLAASALIATTAASANPVYPVYPVYPVINHHPVNRAVMLGGPIAYRHEFRIAPIYARPVVYREGFARPGFYRTTYYVHGHRGVYFRGFHHTLARRHGSFHHHTAWRGAYAGEHRPA